MSQFNVGTLADITADTSGIAAGQTNSASDVTTWISDVETRIQNLNDAAQAIATMQSGSSAPTARQGEIFFDTDDTSWFGDPDGSGHDSQFLDELTGYLADMATAGTATFRIGGPLVVDTTQVALAGSTGVLESYTLPAGTLARNGQHVEIIAWGTKTGANADASIQARFNTGVEHTHTLTDDADEWFIRWFIVRTGATTQKFCSTMIMDRDDTGETDLVGVGTDAETLANALAIDLNLSAVNGSDTVTKEVMIVRFWND